MLRSLFYLLFPTIEMRSERIFNVFRTTIHRIERVNEDAQKIVDKNAAKVAALTQRNADLNQVIADNVAVSAKMAGFLKP